MKNLIKRIAALFSAGCVLAANGLCFTVSAEDQPMIDNGYWEFTKKEKAVPDTYTSVMEHAEDRTLTVVEYSFGKVSGKSNVSADVGDGYGHDYLLAGDSTSATLTYEEPKDKYYPGDTFTSEVEIVSSGWEKRSEYLGSLWTTMICSMTVRTGSLEESEDGGDVFESETILSCVVKGTESTDLKTDSDGKSGESGTLECVIPEHYYDTMRISVSTGYQSVVSGTPTQDSFFYYYKWVPVMVPVEADTESAADDSTSESTADSADDSVWIIQDESENALESAGEDSGTEIDETIIKGKDHKPKSDGQKRSEDTAAKTAGVVGGSGVAAAAAAKKKNKDKKTAFKMMISKDFGDAICRGAEPVYVRARIIEVDEKGNIKSRPDLTGMITVRTDGLLLHGISSDGGAVYERYIPFRLIGEVDEDMGNWDKEYSELKRRVEKFSLPAEKEKWL